MKRGDVVQLKSGGPKMTVSYVDGEHKADKEAICIFFDGAGEMDKVTVSVECLKPAEADKSGVKRPGGRRRMAKNLG